MSLTRFLVAVLVGLIIWSAIRIARDLDRSWPPLDSKPLEPPERYGDGGEA